MTGRILIGMLALLLGGCFEFLESEVAETQAEVEAFIGARLPADAGDVRIEVGGFQDTFVLIRFSASPESAAAFLGTIGIVLEDGLMPSQIADPMTALDWWTPETAQVYAGGQRDDYAVNLFYRALADQTNPALWTIYLLAYNT